MKILFFPIITSGAALGTISRCLSIAEALRKRGHEACFLIGNPVVHLVDECGFEFYEGPIPEATGELHALRNLADVAVFLNLTKESHIRAAMKAESMAIERFKPDAIFSEFKLTAPITAAKAGIPLVSTACSPAHPKFISPLYEEELRKAHKSDNAHQSFNEIIEEEGLQTVNDISELFFMRSSCKITPTSPEIEPLLSDVENMHYVGYLLYDRWERAPLPEDLFDGIKASNLLFAYFGAGEIGPDRYMPVLENAFQGTEFHLLIAVGNHPDLPELPLSTDNVKYVRFIPGSSILEKCAGLIFHGGQNTAMASLIHGVPSLIIPGSDFERDFNARQLDRINTGIHMAVDDFNPDDVLQAMRKLQHDHYKEHTFRYGNALRSLKGPEKVADIILETAS